MNKSKVYLGSMIFDTFNIIMMLLFSLTIIYPFLYLASMSFSTTATNLNPLNLIPRAITYENYKTIFNTKFMLTGYINTFERISLAIVLVLLATILTAYPLSKKYLPYRSVITGLMVFTMFFSGGLIPKYILVRSLGLRDTVWSLVLPGLISTYSMLIMRNYFMSIPSEMEESAKVDGANDYRVLFQIIVPISKPIIATVLLWTVVGHWNAWFDAMIYISDSSKQVLQVFLRHIVISGYMEKELEESTVMMSTSVPEGLRAATIIYATLPVVCFYPFVQKYFVKGIMVGSLKG